MCMDVPKIPICIRMCSTLISHPSKPLMVLVRRIFGEKTINVSSNSKCNLYLGRIFFFPKDTYIYIRNKIVNS